MTKTVYFKSGKNYTPSSKEALDLHEELPPSNFIVQQLPNGTFYLQEVEPFEIPSKLYGDTSSLTNRIIRTFFDRQSSTGVLLTGEKGSGKSLLAKKHL